MFLLHYRVSEKLFRGYPGNFTAMQLVDDKNLGNYREAHKKALLRVLSCLTDGRKHVI